jgi:5'-phosphate synthase pdxT subunit
MARIGVLALQGGFAAHERALADLGHEPVPVRRPSELATVEGIALPGGESSTMLKLLDFSGLAGPLDAFVREGRPVLATCAGLILAARHVTNPAQRSFGWLDVSVSRNAWGRQLDSFEAVADEGQLPLVFIRAPRIVELGSDVEVLARFRGEPVMVRQGNVTGASFHPELTEDRTVHEAVFGRAE